MQILEGLFFLFFYDGQCIFSNNSLVVRLFFLYSLVFNNIKTAFYIIKNHYDNIKIFLNYASIKGFFFSRKKVISLFGYVVYFTIFFNFLI